MNRRRFLAASSLGAAALSVMPSPAAAGSRVTGPVLLTVTGAVTRSNRGPLNPALDQMMHKQNVKFDKAYTFDFSAITALPAITIQPTLEYDAKRHVLRGPLVSAVVEAAGGQVSDGTNLLLQAVDGYGVLVPLKDAERYRFIVATHLDDEPMSLGGLGPLWAVYDADEFPDMAAKPLSQRFALCPWALYRIDVQTGDA